jgi:guanylate kinase
MWPDPRLLVISGPSGSGKTTLIRRLLEDPGVRLAVSATTRARRPGERDGVDYRFLGPEEFGRLRAADGLLEWAEVYGTAYGTPRSELASRGPGERLVILDIDVQGRRNMAAAGIPFTSVFIAPPSLAILEARLRGRGSENEASLARRLEGATREMEAMDEYDHVLVNENVDTSICTLRRLAGLDEVPPAAHGRSKARNGKS